MNKLKIKWSLYAKQSLDIITDYIKQDSPLNAKMVKKTLLTLAGSLNVFPEKLPKDPFMPKSKGDFRFVSKWNYKIIYAITTKEIIIIDVFHTAQSPDKLVDALEE